MQITPTASMTSCIFEQPLTFVNSTNSTVLDLSSSTTPLKHVSITSTIRHRWGRFTNGVVTLVSIFRYHGNVQYSQSPHVFVAMCRYIHKGDAYSQPSTLTPAFDAHTPPAMIPRRPAVHCPHIGYVVVSLLNLYVNFGNSPSGGGMCIKRNVRIGFSLATSHHLDTPS